MAEKTEVHLSFIGQMERGLKKPSLKTVKRIAEAFGIKAGDLLDESPPKNNPHPLERKIADLISDRSPEEQAFLFQTLKQLARQTKKLASR